MRLPRIFAPVVVAFLCACGASPTGTLAVVLSTPPAGLDAGFTVTGPSAFVRSFAGPLQLALAPGPYTVVANRGLVPDPIVGELFASLLSGSPATVAVGTTATVTASYTFQPGSARLWTADCGRGPSSGSAVGYSVADLRQDGGTLDGGWTLATSDGGCAEAVAFDRAGNAWVVDYDGALRGYTLAADGGVSSLVVLRQFPDGGGLGSPQTAAFAPNGDLWVADFSSESLVRLLPAQLLDSGVVVPANVIPSVDAGQGVSSLGKPYDLAFDGSGNLWVANYKTPGSLARFSVQDGGMLEAVPSMMLLGHDGLLANLNGISFDPNGNLWVAGYGGAGVGRVVIPDGGGAVPVSASTVILGDAGYSFSSPASITFDARGNLWVLDFDQQLVRIDNPSALSGAVTPAAAVRFLNAPAADTGRMQFDPPAPGMNLNP